MEKSKFNQLARSMNALQKDQEGKIKGGFAVLSTLPNELIKEKDKDCKDKNHDCPVNNNYVAHCGG